MDRGQFISLDRFSDDAITFIKQTTVTSALFLDVDDFPLDGVSASVLLVLASVFVVPFIVNPFTSVVTYIQH